MAWLEIIEIRAVGSNRFLLESRLQELIDELNQEQAYRQSKCTGMFCWKLILVFTFCMIHKKQI